jgi:catechol 2,3-dioxygenase-like lactoylglutathione lyase family enzyme
MESHLDHHVAVRVSDIDSAIRFYEHALRAKLVAGPAERGGPYIEEVFGPGAVAKVCHLRGDSGAIELWQFVAPVHPVPRDPQVTLGVMHFAVWVDDLDETVARVVAAGGKQRFPLKPVGRSQTTRFCYCEDPDGNVFEVMDASHEDILDAVS